MNLLFLAAFDDTAGGVIVTILIGIGGFIIAIAWIVFPFIVISKCNEVIKLLARIEDRPPPRRVDLETVEALLTGLRESANEISKGLQWMIDNWLAPRT